MILAKRIKQRRKELGLTQDDLAKKLGYKSRSSINKIELGLNDITQHKVVLFAEALQTTPSYLMGWDEEEIDEVELLADITIRMRSDQRFADVVKCIYEMNDEQLDAAKIFLTTFNK